MLSSFRDFVDKNKPEMLKNLNFSSSNNFSPMFQKFQQNRSMFSMMKQNDSPIENVRAEDYVTPQKYLDGAEVPTFYQFQSNMVTDDDLRPGMIRIVEVDKRLTLPTRTHIRALITATDVIHDWAVPSLGLKIDACPGRLNRTFIFIQREGVFYGQCSELCGVLHGMMPIVIEAVAPEVYAKHARKWYKDA